jgi:hypothetical protein
MPIIQDERKRMVAHGDTAEKICNGKCSDCAQDQRIYEGLISTNSSTFSSYACPVGLTYGTRVERFCEENPSEYRSNVVLPAARNLIIDSLGNFDPDKIKKDEMLLREYLVNEESFPIDRRESLPMTLAETPLALKISLSTSMKRRFPRGLPHSLLF